jgi:hypothetical protein
VRHSYLIVTPQKHEAGKPVEIRRGRATVIGPNFARRSEARPPS